MNGVNIFQEQGDLDVPPEDEKFFDTPDVDAMEEAISKFLKDWSNRRGGASQKLTPTEPGTGWTLAELNKQYLARSSCARSLDHSRMCGMGVGAVQGHHTCQVLSLWHA